jgi:hypothetical protein
VARNPKSTTALGRTLEDRVAKDYNGQRSRSSGAAAGRKGDVRYNLSVHNNYERDPYYGESTKYQFLAECKTTEAKSFSVKKETWDKVVQEAREAGRRPCMFIRFYNDETGKHTDLVIRDVEDDLEMLT